MARLRKKRPIDSGNRTNEDYKCNCEEGWTRYVPVKLVCILSAKHVYTRDCS